LVQRQRGIAVLMSLLQSFGTPQAERHSRPLAWQPIARTRAAFPDKGRPQRWSLLPPFLLCAVGRRISVVARHVSTEPRRAVISGGTSRFGRAIAQGLAESKRYQELILIGRNRRSASEALKSLEEQGVKGTFIEADLSALSEVQEVATSLQTFGPLHCLICAAGATALPLRRETVDGFEYQFGLNFLSRFALVNAVKDCLAASDTDPARILLTGSDRHWGEPFLGFSTLGGPVPLALGDLEDLQLEKPGAYTPWKAFGQAALCNVMFAYELQRRFLEEGSGISVACFDPGPMSTAWSSYRDEENRMLAASVASPLHDFFSYFTRLVYEPEEAANLPIKLATLSTGIGTLGYWQDGGPSSSKVPLPWSPGTSYDQTVWKRLWVYADGMIAKPSRHP